MVHAVFKPKQVFVLSGWASAEWIRLQLNGDSNGLKYISQLHLNVHLCSDLSVYHIYIVFWTNHNTCFHCLWFLSRCLWDRSSCCLPNPKCCPLHSNEKASSERGWQWQEEWVSGVKWLLHKLGSQTHNCHTEPAVEVHTYNLTTRGWEEINAPPELTVQPAVLVSSRISKRPHLKNDDTHCWALTSTQAYTST